MASFYISGVYIPTIIFYAKFRKRRFNIIWFGTKFPYDGVILAIYGQIDGHRGSIKGFWTDLVDETTTNCTPYDAGQVTYFLD